MAELSHFDGSNQNRTIPFYILQSPLENSLFSTKKPHLGKIYQKTGIKADYWGAFEKSSGFLLF
jgi:hypothetical protein